MDENYIATLISTMQHIFVGIIVKASDKRPLGEQLSEYEHWEAYDPTRSYSRSGHLRVRNGRAREYFYYLLILISEEKYDLYVVTQEDPEMRALESYCPCYKCQASYLNPLKYIWCDHCTRCLKAGKEFTSSEYIAQAKAAASKATQSHPSRTWNYSIKQVEASVVLMTVLVWSVLWMIK